MHSWFLLFTLAFGEEMHDVQVVEMFKDEPEESEGWGPRVLKPRGSNAKATAVKGTMPAKQQNRVWKEMEQAIKSGESVESYFDDGFDIEGAEVYDIRRLGYTPLVTAIVHRHPALVKQMLDRGADPDLRTIWLTSPLSTAAFCKIDDPVATDACIEIIDLLLEYGADIDGRIDDGWTALFVAARNRNLRIVDHLLAKGADTSIVETFNNKDQAQETGIFRDYLDHALLRSDPEWPDCKRGKPSVKGNCNRVYEWAKAKIAERDATKPPVVTVEITDEL